MKHLIQIVQEFQNEIRPRGALYTTASPDGALLVDNDLRPQILIKGDPDGTLAYALQKLIPALPELLAVLQKQQPSDDS